MRSTAFPWLSKINPALMVGAVWIVAAFVLISHFRFYYGVGWNNAVKWGVGDGLIWGLLLCALVRGGKQFLTKFPSVQGGALYLGIAVFTGVVLHPTVSTLFFWVIDGSISRPFLEDVHYLVMKRLPQGVLVGFIIAFLGMSSAGISSRKQEVKSGSRQRDVPAPIPIEAKASWLTLKDAGGVRRVNINDIRYVEAAGNYVALSARNAEHLERTTLKAMEKQLQGYGFHRISRKHLVNLDYVRSVESAKPKGAVVILDDGGVLTVSRQYKKALFDAFISRSREE